MRGVRIGNSTVKTLVALFCLVWAIVATAPPIGAETYSWTDAGGVRRFSDRPPLDIDMKTVTKTESLPPQGQIQATDSGPEAAGPDRTAEEAEAQRLKVQQEQEARRRLEAEQAEAQRIEAQRIEAERKKAARQQKSAAKRARIRSSRP